MSKRVCLIKYISWILFLFLIGIITFCAIPSYSKADSEEDFAGSGHRLDPYLIESVEDLCKFRDNVNSGIKYENAYFEQTVDLDLKDFKNWEPIGQYDTEHYFAGVYNGNGHTISNLRIEKEDNVALFAFLAGTVMNLGIESGVIRGNCAGSIASHSFGEEAKVINCYNQAKIKGIRAGGIVDNFSGIVSDCWNAGKLKGDMVGGITSYNADYIIHCDSLSYKLYPKDIFTGTMEDSYQQKKEKSRVDELKEAFRQRTEQNIVPLEQMVMHLLPGEGTEDAPYQIRSVRDLCIFRSLVNLGYPFNEQWICQEADLDLSGIENWIPIGIFGQGHYFNGIYNGNGHTVSNLSIQSDSNVGFFGVLSGTVINFGVDSGYIRGACVGGIASHASGQGNPVILNCFNNASLEGSARAGGIADNFSEGMIANCYNSGTVSGAFAQGGIVSYTAKRVINCHSYENITNALFQGIVENSCQQFTTLEEVSKRLNAELYSVATEFNFQRNNLYNWTEEGRFHEIYPYRTFFFLREAGIAAVICLTGIVLYLLWHISERKLPFQVTSVRSVVRERIEVSTSTLSSRIRLLMSICFLLFTGLLLSAFLCRDQLIGESFFFMKGVANDYFMDFYVPLHTMLDNNFEQEGFYEDIAGTYPPVARGLFWLLGQILPFGRRMASARGISASSLGSMLFILFNIACLLCLLFLFLSLNRYTEQKRLLPFFLVFSAPMVYLIERGNILIIVVLLSAVFVKYYQSENAFMRHVAYIALAVAAAIKIYPAILGVLLLKDRNWKYTIQCAVYGVTVCLVPFCFIGGTHSLLLYIRNITTSFGKNEVNVNEWLLNYSNMMAGIGKYLFQDEVLGRTVAKYSIYPLMLLLILCALLCKEKWKSILAVVLILILYPGYSAYYIACFYAIPAIYFINEEHTRKIDYIYAVLLCFTLLPWQLFCGVVGVKQGTVFEFVGMCGLFLSVLLIIDCFVQWIKSRKAKEHMIHVA